MVVLGPLGPPAPDEGREDTFWLDVVGIPFELWCSMASCTDHLGYVFPEGAIAYLAARRDAGDFRQPVSLVKRYRRPRAYRFIAPVGRTEPIEIETARRRHDEELIAALSNPEPILSRPGPDSYQNWELQATTFRGPGVTQIRFEWLKQHMRCGGRLNDTGWPERAECDLCHEELVTQPFSAEGLSVAVIKRMVPPPNPGLARRY